FERNTFHSTWALEDRKEGMTAFAEKRQAQWKNHFPSRAGYAAKASKVPSENMNMFMAINSAMTVAMEENPKTVMFGEDVAFGGVFRCSVNMRERFGPSRVFNSPLTEQGIAGFAFGMAATGQHDVIAEMQFADYIFPAFDQIVNEGAKYRYRSSGAYHVGGVTFRAPCGAVGHGGLYHSQSVEAFFAHCPGIKIAMPRSALQAKGLLLACIRDRNPCIFFEPKALYRASSDEVPVGDFEIPLGEADIVREGSDVTIIAWGNQVHKCMDAADMVTKEGISTEVVDLQTILPWDREAVVKSVKKTGRCIIAHEAPMTNGFGAELAAKVQADCFLSLLAPVNRVTGFDTPFPLAWEEFYVPNKHRVADAIRNTVNF
ncbi:hypothetical protein FOZ63_028555, partial [Perkinsus olseni]